MRKKNILYISGTRRTTDDNGNQLPYEKSFEKQYIMSQFGDRVIEPDIFWDRGDYLSGYLSTIIENENIDTIIGYSAGGYLGFYLCNKYKIPGLQLNPAIANNCLAPKLQTLDDRMKSAPLYSKQIILMGAKDTKDAGGVDYHLAKQFFEEIKFEEQGGEIIIEPELEHRVDTTIFEKYFTYFREKMN